MQTGWGLPISVHDRPSGEDTMTNRERVIASIEHRQPDWTPFEVGFTQPAYARYAE